jgi:peptidoglycan/xylan/chitin deacetylase (PgdA/CDA1 family)
MIVRNSTRTFLLASFALLGATASVAPGCSARPTPEAVRTAGEDLTRSSSPPGGLQVSQVPQFVAVTFDDNFNTEGMDWATGFFRPLVNPAGSGHARTFDGASVRTTFPSNSVYLGGMQASWQTAVNDGHEFANHTVNHGDGIGYSVDQWNTEITNCTSALLSGLSHQSPPVTITGFRSPYLHYNDNLFTVLTNNAFVYDTSIMGCWADAENGRNCPWPYTLESGSPDADTIFNKWSGRNVVQIGPHAGLWELPVSVVFVPDDSLAAQYAFPAGLRGRIQNLLGSAANPNFFEQSTGKLVGMDITMLLDGQMTRAEALATLKYTLDLHRAGNRAPMIFVAHTHVYASNWDGNAPGTPNTADRRSIIQDFVNYALSMPEVRMRPLADVLAWMENPVALGGVCTPTTCAAQGKNCGSISDGCGGTLNCGTCASGQTCSASNVCQASCAPTTCSAQSKNCGSIPDGCGGTLNCGTCATGQTCSSGNVCQSSNGNCTPTVSSYQLGKCNATAVYNGNLYKCISQAVNVNGETTGCGTTGVYCSSIAPDNASWGTTAWQLVQSCTGTGCAPTTCSAQGKNCGSISDGCGGTLNCGACPSGQTCSSANVCQVSCTPTTCSAQGKNCGSISDGCGGTLNCGACASGQTCSSANVCQASGGTCNPTVTSYQLGKCNATAVYNGKLYKCISQAVNVNGETAGCGTTGVYCGSIAPDNAAWGATAWQFVQNCP